MRTILVLAAILAFTAASADARGYNYGGGHHTSSHGGTYYGGSGSSHRGGHYVGPHGGYGTHQ